MHPIFRGRFLSSRFFDVQGMRVRSPYYEKLLSDHLDYIKASGDPCEEISSARDADNAKVHTLFEEYCVNGSEGRKKNRIAFVATQPGKSSLMVQGLGWHAENPLYRCFSDPDEPIPSNITAVAYKGHCWSLKPNFVELTLALGCADGNVVFLNYSEFWKKVTNPSGIEKKVFKITDGPIQCIDRGQLRGDWIVATDDSLILWRKKTKERWVYKVPEVAKNRCAIQAVRNYDGFIVYALSNGMYGTIAPYTQDECDIITARDGSESFFGIDCVKDIDNSRKRI